MLLRPHRDVQIGYVCEIVFCTKQQSCTNGTNRSAHKDASTSEPESIASANVVHVQL